MAELTKEFLDSEIAGLTQNLAEQEKVLAVTTEKIGLYRGAIFAAQKYRAHLDLPDEIPPLRAVDAETDSKENEHGSS